MSGRVPSLVIPYIEQMFHLFELGVVPLPVWGYTINMIQTGPLETAPDLKQRIKQLLRLVELSVTLNSTLNLEELLQFIIQTAAEVLDCEAASILLYDEKRVRLFFAAATGSDPRKLAEMPVPIEGSIAGTIFRTNRALILNDVQKDPRHYPLVSKQVGFQPRSLLGVPMRIRERVTGVLEALNKRQGVFTEADERILSVVASHAAVAIHNARLVQALQQAYDEVSEADKMKSNFLTLASHELRTPLGIIIGYATFLQEESQGELSEHAEHVLNAALRMRSIVDAMANMTLLKAEGLTFRLQNVPIQRILESACEEIPKLAEAKNQEVTLTLPPRSLVVNVDIEKTTLAFVNVLNNAARFSPEGGKITVGAEQQGQEVFVWVQDKGVGIPPDQLEKIFQEFYQVEPPSTRRHGGLGIGLTIARGLIEAQGGQIWAESEGLGKGATFKVLLPAAEDQ